MKKIFLLTFAVVMSVSIHLRADLQADIDYLFFLLETSVNDSKFGEVNGLLLRYKRTPVELGQLLSATKVYNDIGNTTPLHLSARQNFGITVIILQKSAAVPWEGDFRYQIANAIDNNENKPIDYAGSSFIFTVLNTYTVPPRLLPNQIIQSRL